MQVLEQALWLLGNLAGEGATARDAVLAVDALPPLVRCLERHQVRGDGDGFGSLGWIAVVWGISGLVSVRLRIFCPRGGDRAAGGGNVAPQAAVLVVECDDSAARVTPITEFGRHPDLRRARLYPPSRPPPHGTCGEFHGFRMVVAWPFGGGVCLTRIVLERLESGASD